MQLGDVVESFADIEHSEKIRFYPKISIENGIPMFINWFKDFHTNRKKFK